MISNPGKWFIQLAGQLTAPLFSRGANISRLKGAKAQQQQALNNFKYSLLNAATEVNDYLVAYENYNRKAELLKLQTKNLEEAVDMTNLLLTHDGRKMGKTEKGALWLDPAKTSPYDFYQYWRNVDDQDVEKCLGLLTFLPMDEVRRLGALKDSQINEAKKVLAYEVTKLVHGEEEAEKAQEAAASLFGGAAMGGSIPTTEITAADLEKDARVTTLLVTCGLAPSNSAARRLVQGGGVSLGEDKVTDVNAVVTADMIPTDGLLLRSGKKKFHRIVLK